MLATSDDVQQTRTTPSAQEKLFVSAAATYLDCSVRRHTHYIAFSVHVPPRKRPVFLCTLPTDCLWRGPISAWTWERMDWGTRLWVPTELIVRASILGLVLHDYPAAVCRIAGAAGLNGYRDPRNWMIEIRNEFAPPFENSSSSIRWREAVS